MPRFTRGDFTKDCDRCGFSFKLKALRRQDGILVCADCFDEKTTN